MKKHISKEHCAQSILESTYNIIMNSKLVNQPKYPILFYKKSPMEEFTRKTLYTSKFENWSKRNHLG